MPSTLVTLDLVGIFVFAISGGLVAVRKDLDLFGVLVLAGTTGLGGGFLRDVLIGATPPAALADWRYLLVPVGAGLVTFLFHPALGRMERTVNVFDAFGLSLFCVAGAIKALDYGLGPVPAALMGMVTGIGGGMLRDLLAGPGAGGVPQRALRNPGAGRLRASRSWASARTCRPSRWPLPGPACAWSGACWRCGATGGRRCPPGPASVVSQSPRTRRR